MNKNSEFETVAQDFWKNRELMFQYEKSHIPCSLMNRLQLSYSHSQELGEETREVIASARIYYEMRKKGCCDSEALCSVIDTYPEMKKYISSAITFSFKDIFKLFNLKER